MRILFETEPSNVSTTFWLAKPAPAKAGLHLNGTAAVRTSRCARARCSAYCGPERFTKVLSA